MAAPILLIAGTVLQMAGQYGANLAQARAEIENAKFYEKQKDLAITAYQSNIAKEQLQYQYQKGRAVSAIAGGGADVGSGSSILQIANLSARNLTAISQIKEQSMLDIELAGHRARRSRELAGTLESPGYNLMQAGTTALTNYAGYLANQRGESVAPDFRGPINVPGMSDPGVVNMPAYQSQQYGGFQYLG